MNKHGSRNADFEDYSIDCEHLQTAYATPQQHNCRSHLRLLSRTHAEFSFFRAHCSHHHFDCQLQERGRRTTTACEIQVSKITPLTMSICKRHMPRHSNTIVEAITDSSLERTPNSASSVLTAATTILIASCRSAVED